MCEWVLCEAFIVAKMTTKALHKNGPFTVYDIKPSRQDWFIFSTEKALVVLKISVLKSLEDCKLKPDVLS